MGDDVGIGGERAAHLERAVVGDQHHLVAGLHLGGQEVAQVLEHPVAVGGVDVEVVDVDDEEEALLGGHLLAALAIGQRHLRRRRRIGAGGPPGLVAAHLVAALDGVEVGHLHRPLVLVQLEVVLGQAGHPVALLVGHVDVDVDHLHVHRVDEDLQVLRLARRLVDAALGGLRGRRLGGILGAVRGGLRRGAAGGAASSDWAARRPARGPAAASASNPKRRTESPRGERRAGGVTNGERIGFMAARSPGGSRIGWCETDARDWRERLDDRPILHEAPGAAAPGALRCSTPHPPRVYGVTSTRWVRLRPPTTSLTLTTSTCSTRRSSSSVL